ncbi:MAG: hypothetical protein N2B60_05275 [Psychrobacter sp.]
MKYLSLALFCIAVSACNVSNEGTAEIDTNDAIKINTNDAIKVSSSDNATVKISGNEALKCHNTIPDWQAKELAQVPCLTLPISNQDFLNIKKFDNGMFDVEGDNRFTESKIWNDEYIPLGLISFNDEETFLITFKNDQYEDVYPNQSFHIYSIKTDNEENSSYPVLSFPLGLLNYDFQEDELVKLGIDPNEFADINFNTLGEENIRIDDVCMMNFNIDTDWKLTRSYSCQDSHADKETIDSFKEQFGFEYKLVNTDMGVDYKRVD